MLAEIIDAACTGCDLCIKVCPTIALSLRDRKPSEMGPGKRIAEVDPKACYNVQNCVEICPHDAIVMHELETPFTIGTDVSMVDASAIEDLAARAGLPSSAGICVCTETTVAEIAASILLGADTPEKVSLATGARTGCTEICAHGILSLLAAAGHERKAPTNTKSQFQMYEMCGSLWSNVGVDGAGAAAIIKDFPSYPVALELQELHELQTLKANAKV
jgi:ferredoxin